LETHYRIQWEINAPQFQTDLILDRSSLEPLCHQYPKISVVVDTGSCEMIPENPIEFYDLFSFHIRHFHFSYFDSWMEKSSGIYHRNKTLFHYLIQTNYRGYITIEIAKAVPSVFDYIRIFLGIHI